MMATHAAAARATPVAPRSAVGFGFSFFLSPEKAKTLTVIVASSRSLQPRASLPSSDHLIETRGGTQPPSSPAAARRATGAKASALAPRRVTGARRLPAVVTRVSTDPFETSASVAEDTADPAAAPVTATTAAAAAAAAATGATAEDLDEAALLEAELLEDEVGNPPVPHRVGAHSQKLLSRRDEKKTKNQTAKNQKTRGVDEI
jgi:hypothetical protein